MTTYRALRRYWGRFTTLGSALFLGLSACSDSSKVVSDVVTPADTDEPDIILPGDTGDTRDTTQSDTDVSTPDTPDTPCEGCTGAPCTHNSDCESNFCVPGPEGYVCSRTCLEGCPDGFSCRPISNGGADATFVCLYDFLPHCMPCDSNAACIDALNPTGNMRCHSFGESQGSFCLNTCQFDFDCPSNTRCEEQAGGEKLCVPNDNQCDCSPYAISREAKTTCSTTNTHGSCQGVRVCGEEGLSACGAATPSSEVCDGIDNDCDGQTDESYPEQGQACDSDDPDQCEDDVKICQNGQIVCQDRAQHEAVEICDGIDNDCDGLTDAEDPDFVITACENAVGVCQGAQHLREECVNGAWLPCGTATFLAHTPLYDVGQEVRCDGLDNDCDGQVDDDFVWTSPGGQLITGIGQACGEGACGAGTTVCGQGGQGIVCSSSNSATTEVCDGIDNSCNGLVDAEDPNLQRVLCSLQSGVCQGARTLSEDCQNGSWVECSPTRYLAHSTDYQPDTEQACDGLDNDCDGQIDEDFTVSMPDGRTHHIGESCGVGRCAGGIARCGEDGLICSSAENIQPEVCNGIDDNCDGTLDSQDPTLERPMCENQQGVCAGARKPANRCVSGQWQACGANDYEAHNSTFQAQAEQFCDGIDEDCSGEADEDFSLTMPDGTVIYGVGKPCGVGACAGGVTRCRADGLGIECSSMGSISAEVCDGIDNDCDGKVDAEDADLQTVACEEQRGVCQGATKPSNLCVGGQWQACGAPAYAAHSSAYQHNLELACDSLDNDCNGQTDEDFSLELADGSTVQGVGRACGAGACEGGVTACNAAGTGILCDSSLNSAVEICDGIDNDCDGLTDGEDPDLQLEACEEQRGVCQGAIKPASLCVAGQWQACGATTYSAHNANYDGASELRCDGLDNDCDGTADEDFSLTDLDGSTRQGVNTACGVGSCAGGKLACNPAGDGVMCTTHNLVSTEVCDGIDNDCDGQTDAADSSLQLVNCELQSGVCQGSQKPAGLCVAGQWQACGSELYASHNSAYQPNLEAACDSLDNDCDGQTDEDFAFTQLNGSTIYGAGTSCGVGECSGTVLTCNAAGTGLECLGEALAATEVCDGKDNDCDGKTDALDNSMQLVACENQKGVCSGSQKPANFCLGGVWQSCTETIYANYSSDYSPGLELACDGLDNDCDGTADEHFTMTTLAGQTLTGTGLTCGTGACQGGTTTCTASENGIVCSTEHLASAEICDGIDNDCDGKVDTADENLVRPLCEKQLGVCSGSQKPLALCQGSNGWSTCTDATYAAFSAAYNGTTETLCDGVDNDCDGQIDEDFSYTEPDGTVIYGVGKPCGKGVCGGGVTQCNPNGTGLICSTAHLASAEVCDGLDNDCDGKVDGADADLIIPNCENQNGACQGSKKPLSLCQGTAGWGSCTATHYALSSQPNASSYNPTQELRCDNIDNDCDGQTDEDFSTTLLNGQTVSGVNTVCGVGVCANGRTTCNADGNGIICPSESNATAEICDGVDNDCDGKTDAQDNAPEAQGGLVLALCEKTQGVCAGTKHILSECVGGAWQPCAASRYGSHYQANTELSCDGYDNDCDGQTDEDFSAVGLDGVLVTGGVGASCGTGRCAGGVLVCAPGGTGVTCSTNSLAVPEVCGAAAGSSSWDDDCDGQTDGADIEVFPACSNQTGECNGSVQTRWQNCQNGVWGACNATDYGATPGRSYQASETLCDLKDNDCNGTTDGADLVGDGPLHSNQLGVCSGTRQTCASGSWVDNYPSGYAQFEQPNDIPGVGPVDENCDGVDGTADVAFFVSPTGTGTACTKATPCPLATALSQASTTRYHIYLQAGTYVGPFFVTSAVELYGGYDSSWTRGERTQTNFAANLTGGSYGSYAYGTLFSNMGGSTLLGSSARPIRLQELNVIGPTASGTTPEGHGRSSYAIYANNSYLKLYRVGITQGTGATGSQGTNGTNASQTAANRGGNGVSGNRSSSTCDTNEPAGGSAVSNTCEGSTVGTSGAGGKGGSKDRSCTLGVCTSCDARNGTSGNSAGGAGGSGGGTCGGAVGNGGNGSSSNGAIGSGSTNGFGYLSNGWFLGFTGNNGGIGTHGTGGGGGGGAGGCDDGTDASGGGGGGGGAGGCRATAGGQGGKAGGGSFGIFAQAGQLVLDYVEVIRGAGGAGGRGGAAGLGQPGGPGGSGGSGTATTASGGTGGTGGTGGHSGAGGGGAGGPSLGLFTAGSISVQTGTGVNLGADGDFGGAGGQGGTGWSGTSGQGGAGAKGASKASHHCNNLSNCSL